MEYEKLSDHILDPHSLPQMAIEGIKDIGAHLFTQDQR